MSGPMMHRGELPPGWTSADAQGAGLEARLTIEARIAEMRRLLDRMRPTTSAEALGALRAAFPDVPLQHRVAAATRLQGER
ncbi:MAG: hypothetical protein JNM13_07350 [Hyphomicrobiaceae bacterium]|nr:hypothetical protein [Hyphomicrobiaceae bacterium]